MMWAGLNSFREIHFKLQCGANVGSSVVTRPRIHTSLLCINRVVLNHPHAGLGP